MNNAIFPLILSLLAGLSTVIGSLFIFIKFKNREGTISLFLSFSASIMISISILDLIPSGFITLINYMDIIYVILLIILFVMIGNYLVKIISKISPLPLNQLYRVGVLNMIVLVLHNVPEGILTFMSSYNDLKSGIALTIAIMMHNIPEGISIAMPIYYSRKSKARGVVYSLISGLSEPLGAIMAYILLKDILNDVSLSIILLIVSGIMISLSINELFPLAFKYNNKKEIRIGFILGLIISIITLISL